MAIGPTESTIATRGGPMQGVSTQPQHSESMNLWMNLPTLCSRRWIRTRSPCEHGLVPAEQTLALGTNSARYVVKQPPRNHRLSLPDSRISLGYYAYGFHA